MELFLMCLLKSLSANSKNILCILINLETLMVLLLAITVSWSLWFFFLMCCMAAIEASFGLVVLVNCLHVHSSAQVKTLFLALFLEKRTYSFKTWLEAWFMYFFLPENYKST